MSLSVQRSVVESFNFNGKHVRSVYAKDVGQCVVSKDVYETIRYGKEDGVKAIQRLVPDKYKIRFGNAMINMKEVDNSVHLHPDTILLKKPGLYCFLLRSKRDEAEPFMEWVVETVLPREVRKLASVIEEKDNQIQAPEFRNKEHQQKIFGLNKEINDLIKNRHVARRGYLTTCYIPSRRIAEKLTHTTLFDVNMASLKNIRTVLGIFTQAWRWLTNVTIPTLFTDGTYSRVK